MTGTLYQHTETGEIYILMEINPKENTWFVFRNIRTLQERVLYGWGNFYEYFKPITEEQ